MKHEDKAKAAVYTYITKELHKDIGCNDVYIVWACHILGNEKYLLSTNIEDGRYYEVTVSGERGEVYIDSYIKEHNVYIPLDRFWEHLRFWRDSHE